MELLIKRDRNFLDRCAGKAFVNSDVPEFLKSPNIILNGFNLDDYTNDDLLLMNDKDWSNMESWLGDKQHPKSLLSLLTNGLWSGYRSALVRDEKTKKLYKIKGAAVDLENPEVEITKYNFRFWGGQKMANAENEAVMSRRFNKILESEGIETVMEPKGVWKYDVLSHGHRPTASIFEVKGDTRLDELVCAIETLTLRKEPSLTNPMKNYITQKTIEGATFFKHTTMLLHDIGFIVGRLKRLMDKRGQVWGNNDSGTNAHWGNILLYRSGDKLKVNLVDFDMSSDRMDFSKSEIRDMQRSEYFCLSEGPYGLYFGSNESSREIKSLAFSEEHHSIGELRIKLQSGFNKGYHSNKHGYSNELDIGRLDDIYALLRKDVRLLNSTRNMRTSISINNSDKYNLQYLRSIIRDK